MSGARDIEAIAANTQRVTPAQARNEARVQSRLQALYQSFPELSQNQPSFVAALAQNTAYDDSQMMEAAIDTIGGAGLARMTTELQAQDRMQQIKSAQSMNTVLRDALVANGWKIPEGEDRGIVGDIMGGAGRVLSPVLQAGKTVATPLVYGLKAMEWLGDAVGSPFRTAPIMDSQRRLLDQTGLSPEQLEARTGIRTGQASTAGNLTAPGALGNNPMAPLVGNPLGFIQNPGDAWKAVRTWWQLGVEGDNDYLAEVEYEVYSALEDQTPGTGKDGLRYAKAIAEGQSYREIAEDEEIDPAQVQTFVDNLAAMANTPGFKAALSRLESGRVSYGRNVARSMWKDPTADVSHGFARLISGGSDAYLQLAADPTLVAGKVSKGIKAARWAYESIETVERAEQLAHAARLAEEFGDDAAEVTRALEGITGRGWRAGDIGLHRQRLLLEGKAYGAPVAEVTKAFETGDFKALVRKYPGFERSIGDMLQFDAAAQAAGFTGMRDPNRVFDFYKFAADGRSQVATLNDAETAKLLRTNSYKLFGYDGGGQFVVPHSTYAQRQALALREGFGNWLWDRDPGNAKALKALAEAADEVVATAEETGTVATTAAEQRARLTELALNDDQGVAEAARLELRALDKADARALDQAGTLGSVRASGNGLRRQLQKFATAVGTRVNERSALSLLQDNVDFAEEFGRWNEMVELLSNGRRTKGYSKALADARYNQFIASSPAGRHAMINKMIFDMSSASGIIETTAGRDFIRQFITESNRVFGYNDAVRHTLDDRAWWVKHAVMERQAEAKITVPSFRDMLVASRNANKVRWVAGGIRNSNAEAFMTRVWKPLTMFRMGFPLRAGGDEALQFMGRVGAKDYFRQAVVLKWAGLEDEAGKVLAEPRAAVAPVRSFLRGISEVAGVTDSALSWKVEELAAMDPKWATATREIRQEILERSRVEVRGELRALPRSIRWLDDQANHLVATTSRRFHELAGDSTFLSRKEWARKLLEGDANMAQRQHYARLRLLHPTFEHAVNQQFGHAFTQGAADMRVIEKGLNAQVVELADRSPGVARSVRLDYGDEYGWVGHEDLGLLIHHFDKNIRDLAASGSTRQAMFHYAHFTPPAVTEDVAAKWSWAKAEGDFRNPLRSAREAVARVGADETDLARRAQFDKAVGQLRAAAATHPDDLSYRTLEEMVTQLGLDQDIASDPQLRAVYDSLRASSPKSRLLILNDRMQDGLYSDDLTEVTARMAQATYNELRSLYGSEKLRQMVQAAVMDGTVVAEPLRDGHTRLYSAMLDRRSANDVLNLLRNPNQAEAFADAIVANLRRSGNAREAAAAFDAMAPQQTYELMDQMLAAKADLVSTGQNYIAGGLAASSNFTVAEAIRDALTDLLPAQTFKPTVGYIDHPTRFLSEAYGVLPMEGSASVVNLAPYRAGQLRPIDLDRQIRLVHAELPDGTTRWLGEHELNDVAGIIGRVDGIKVKHTNGLQTFTGFRNGELRVNNEFIKADWRNGRAFLRGEGGDIHRTRAAYQFPDPDFEHFRDLVAAQLDDLGLADTGLTLDDLIGQYKINTPQGLPIAFQDEMEGAANPIWPYFEEVARNANPTTRVIVDQWTDKATAAASANVAEALRRLGVDASQDWSFNQYKQLIVERAKVLEALRAPGVTDELVAGSESAINREMDAMAYAWKRAGLQPTEEMQKRITLITARKTKEDFKVLGEIWTSGVTEEAAVRRVAQHAAQEVRQTLSGAKSAEPLHELILPLLSGQHDTMRVIQTLPLEELPRQAYGPKIVGDLESSYERVLQRGYAGVADPWIAGLARTPMLADGFDKSMPLFQGLHDRLIVPETDAAGREIISRLGVGQPEMNAVNDYLLTKLKSNKSFGAGEYDDDAITAYARAVFNEDRTGAIEALTEHNAVMFDMTPGAIDKERARLASVLDEDTFAQLRGYHLMHSNATEEQVHRATTHAIEMVAPYVDNHRQRSILQEYLGPVFLPFYYAEELFLRRLARGFYETPQMLRKGQLTMNGMRNIGMIRQSDDGSGDELFVIPGSDLALETMASVASLITGNEAYNVDFGPLSVRTQYIMPGWNTEESRFGMGPLIGLSTQYVTTRFPELKWQNQREKDHLWEYLIPGSVVNGYKLISSDPAQVFSSEMSAATYLEANGHGLPPNATPSQREDYAESLRSVSRAISAVKFFSGQFTFAAFAPQDVTAKPRHEYTELLAQGVSYEAAVEIMLQRYGPKGLIYTVFGSDNQVGAPIPVGSKAYDFMARNEEVIANDPASMVWLIPQPADGRDEFDFRAYNESISLGLRQRRSPQEFIDELAYAQSAPGYYNYMEERRAGRKALNEAKAPQQVKDTYDLETEAFKRGYLNMHPILEASFNNDAAVRRQNVLETLPAYIQAGIGGEQGQVLAPLLELYRTYKTQYDSYKGQTSKAARDIKDELTQSFYDDAWLYVKRNPQSSVFFDAVIKPELPDMDDTQNKVN